MTDVNLNKGSLEARLAAAPSLDSLLGSGAGSDTGQEAVAANKAARLFARLGQPCRFYGAEVSVRHVCLSSQRARLDSDYLQEPTQIAEFLRHQGSALAGDEFDTGSIAADGTFTPDGKRYRLTAPWDADTQALSFVCVEA